MSLTTDICEIKLTICYANRTLTAFYSPNRGFVLKTTGMMQYTHSSPRATNLSLA